MIEGVDWAVARRPLPGFTACGDASSVRQIGDGYLIAVVDGLGHGNDAATAAEAALATLDQAGDASIATLFDRCHKALRETRGVAMTLLLWSPDRARLDWAGVGNVEAVLVRADGLGRERALLVGGVVGYRCPPPLVRGVDVRPGDLVLLMTDGIDTQLLDRGVDVGAPLPALVTDLLAREARASDDALVFATRPRSAASG
jgi:negative regulator of sigma-B (phosphoserine phosphatase)